MDSKSLVMQVKMLIAVLAASMAVGADIKVPEEQLTIQAAIDVATDGDVVLVGPGTYEVSTPMVFRGKKIKVRSTTGAEATRIILAAGHDPLRASLVAFESAESTATSLEGFTLEGGLGTLVAGQGFPFGVPGNARVGGAVLIGSHVEARIKDCIFRGNSAEHGGAVFCDVDSAPVLSGNRFELNKAAILSPVAAPGALARGGAIACLADCDVTIGGGEFIGNEADDGGAIFMADDTSLELINVRLEGNKARVDDGGAVLARCRSVRFLGSTFRGNSCGDEGGAVRIHFQPAVVGAVTIVIEECTFTENQARTGGALFFAIGRVFVPGVRNRVEVLRSSFERNEATQAGGAYMGGYESDAAVFDGCRFAHNHAPQGGAVFLGYFNNNTFTRCEFFSNSALLGGAMFGVDEGALQVAQCLFQSNAAAWAGGAVGSARGFAQPRIYDHCTFVGNASGSGGSCIDSGIEQHPGSTIGVLTSSILWGNSGLPVRGSGEISFSCIEGLQPPPGPGNITVDPQFAGWRGPAEVFVDASRGERGDGTQGNPFRDLRDAVGGYQVGLLPGSPCLGTGERGSNMGVDAGRAPVPLASRKILHVLGGRYDFSRFSLASNLSVLGAGVSKTIVDGAVLGLRTGAELEDLTIKSGTPAGIAVGAGESPLIRRVVVVGCKPLSLSIDSPYYYYSNALDPHSPANGGWGVYCAEKSSPVLDHCTLVGNVASVASPAHDCSSLERRSGSGLSSKDALPVLESCIVWGNAGGSILGPAQVARSCVDSPTVFPGDDNTNLDPRFAGWLSGSEVYIDGAAADGGDGSKERPFRQLAQAFEDFGLELITGSPCLGTGRDGSDRGAPTGVVEAGRATARTVHLAAGTHDGRGFSCALGLNLTGAGEGQTTVIGTLFGLRTGYTLSELTLSGGDYTRGALTIAACESPIIRKVTFQHAYLGLHVAGAMPALASCLFRRTAEAARLQAGAKLSLESCVFEGNQNVANLYGGSRLEATNCVFAGCYYGMQILESSQVYLRNCTISAFAADPLLCQDPLGQSFVESCIVAPGVTAAGCAKFTATLKGVDPRFVKRGEYDFNRMSLVSIPGYFEYWMPDFVLTPGDFRLTANSPAIDFALLDGAPGWDLDSNLRPCGSAVDAGAYEFGGCAAVGFRRGDPNADGKVDLADAVFTLGYLFLGEREPICFKAADLDDTGGLDLSDAVGLLRFLFLGAAAPPEPFAGCGEDATADGLGCAGFLPCDG